MNKGRKISGGKYHKRKKKRYYEKQNQQRTTTIGRTKRKYLKTKGGHKKVILLNTNQANILDKFGKIKKTEIKNVIETPQNRFFARSNILMKGAIIETDLGKAKITNRPTQEGCVNAVLLEEQKAEESKK